MPVNKINMLVVKIILNLTNHQFTDIDKHAGGYNKHANGWNKHASG